MRRPKSYGTIFLAGLLCAIMAQGCTSDPPDDDLGTCVKLEYTVESAYARELASGRVGPSDLSFAPILAYADAVITREGPIHIIATSDYYKDIYRHLGHVAIETAIAEELNREADCRVELVETALADIKRLPAADTWRAVRFLMAQNQDYDLVAIAAELALRLDPARFEDLAQALAEGHAAHAAMFGHVREHGRFNQRGW